ncbi:hypothetical protein AMS68_003252 [Peltaster fructicola]|uniref:Phosphoglycerate mutase family protein n=1 Tax=Peltaster fructicola TaxID=286661 RepID=A0A6H0XSV9_9PEZI|nr:hypothetical protein AMS68_003252 [Peltaster fructicola]
MAQQPAVVIIARHGPRLDAADTNWHLNTPTPYDPPLTYGGWKNSTTLGIRIASLLHAREQSLSSHATTTEPPTPQGVHSHDFASSHKNQYTQSRKRKRRTHKVVIHSSPFLRCVQTSVAIAAGLSQFAPPTSNAATRSTAPSRSRTPNHFSVMSPRPSVSDHNTTTGLLAVPESKHGLAQEVSRRVAQGRHKRVKLRVDAFLGEWLNPEYFEDITPPPPSAMMVATAKAELMQNDTIDIFTPSITHKSSRSSLWGGASAGTRPQSRDSALEDWDDIHDSLPPPLSPRRDRTSSHGSVASNDSAGSRTHPYRFGPQSFFRPDTTAYTPPVPTYAMSTSDRIPKGYVAHAKNSCTNIDFHWDSSRQPQDWGDGGEYGEEWSLMQRRFRRGLTHLINWYGQHKADDRGEDALGLDQAEHHDDDLEEQEDLVVIIVTHGAGCNALIGALTGQPVLLDVGTASLTMGVRKDDAPVASDMSADSLFKGERDRRGSLDSGLTAYYDLKIIADSSHLRPGYDPFRSFSSAARPADPLSRLRPARGDSMPSVASSTSWSEHNELAGRGSMSTALGSIRRPHSSSQVPTSAPTSTPGLSTPDLRDTLSVTDSGVTTPSSFTGLWTPPSARTPQMQAKYIRDERREIFSSLDEGVATRIATVPETGSLAPGTDHRPDNKRADTLVETDPDKAEAIEQLREQLTDKSATLTRKVLWAASIEDHPVRSPRDGQKRRWTLQPEEVPMD